MKITLYISFSMSLNYANDCQCSFSISLKKTNRHRVVFRLWFRMYSFHNYHYESVSPLFVGKAYVSECKLQFSSSLSLPCIAVHALQKKNILIEADFIYLNIYVCVYIYFIHYLSAGLTSETECSGDRVYPVLAASSILTLHIEMGDCENSDRKHLITSQIFASYCLSKKNTSSTSASFQNNLSKPEMQAVFPSTDGISRSTALKNKCYDTKNN